MSHEQAAQWGSRRTDDQSQQGSTSDGYHTFDELYDHRIALWIALVQAWGGAWRTRLHSNGSSFPEWFVLGHGKEPGQQITYHLPIYRWDETSFAETLDRAPEYDGHTSADALGRIARRGRSFALPPAKPWGGGFVLTAFCAGGNHRACGTLACNCRCHEIQRGQR